MKYQMREDWRDLIYRFIKSKGRASTVEITDFFYSKRESTAKRENQLHVVKDKLNTMYEEGTIRILYRTCRSGYVWEVVE